MSTAPLQSIVNQQGLFFHIIYTAGTVRQLMLFLPTLLRWSTCSFRIVANGCQAAELERLHRLCAQQPRLDLFILPTVQSWRHGMALNYLQELNTEPYFCFMDSDIFATGPFLPTLTAALAQGAPVFACPPLSSTVPDQRLTTADPIVQGIMNHTQDGLCLGGTYLAIYEQRQLSDLIHTTGLGFETRYWAEIPPAQQVVLTSLGVQRAWYDTGKILNLLLLYQRQPLQWCDIPTLYHLGGVSLNRQYQKNIRTSVEAWLKRRYQQLQGKWNQERGSLEAIWAGTGCSRLAQIRRREIECSRYFQAVLSALDRGQPLPALPKAVDSTVQQQLSTVTTMLIELSRTTTGRSVRASASIRPMDRQTRNEATRELNHEIRSD